ncbi:MAG: YqaJ viral recombinase family protein [Terriglobia bacterium]|nr:YqaJ viral recombinase family protein [Terriglobia bacterium]
MEQLSEEWFAARRGKVTASRLSDVISMTKSGWGAGRGNYMAELITEILTGITAERFATEAMRWGVEKEPDARNAYMFFRDVEVLPAEFVLHPQIAESGASPDGLIGDDGLLEIKCPQTGTHIETLINGTCSSRYITQMQWQMACTGRQWCDFVSFDPRLPAHMQLFVRRFERKQAEIDQLEKDVAQFLKELHAKIATLQSKYGTAKAA